MSPDTPPVGVRQLAARDSLDALTALLHRAYADLAARGDDLGVAALTPDQVRRRAGEGPCFVAESGGELVGVVGVRGLGGLPAAGSSPGVGWASDRDTAHLHLFAVEPALVGQGVGRRLVQAAEQWARESGYRWLSSEVAEAAAELRAGYRRLGYAEAAHRRGPGPATVTMRKALDRSPLGEHLQLMARYNLWATHRLYAAVDRLDDAAYRRPLALPFGSVHGSLNRLLLGMQLLWFRRFAEGHSDVQDMNAEVEPDRARLRARLTDGALAWLPLLDVWPDARLHGSLEYRRVGGELIALPFAATLLHVFNQCTHHRAQIAGGLGLLGQAAPELDLVWMLQEERART
jgi:uncharacterized damage-inducible protein DinB/ribosomal protein S18 acetylase RimI-like enzyme